MKYGLKRGPLGPIEKYLFPYNPIFKLTQHFIKEIYLHFNILCNYNEAKLLFVAYYPLHVDPLRESKVPIT